MPSFQPLYEGVLPWFPISFSTSWCSSPWYGSRAGSPSPATRPVRALRRGVAPGGAGRLGHALMGCSPGWAVRGGRADVRRGHQREQSGMGWADAVGGKGRLIFLYSEVMFQHVQHRECRQASPT
jgi:hypothetical protein